MDRRPRGRRNLPPGGARQGLRALRLAGRTPLRRRRGHPRPPAWAASPSGAADDRRLRPAHTDVGRGAAAGRGKEPGSHDGPRGAGGQGPHRGCASAGGDAGSAVKHPRPPVAPSRGLGIEHFNRGVGTAVALLLLIGGLAAALVAGGVLEPGTAVPAGWLRDRLTDLRDASGSVRTDIAFGAAACAALGAILLVSELRPLSEPRYIQSADGSEREF